MAYRDLREFIEALESKGLLKRIKAEVDPDLEITEITDRVSKMKGEKNVALLFENVKGSKMPVLMNAFGSYERMAMAFGVEKLDDVADELREMMKLPYVSLQNKMSVVTMIPMIKRAINFPKYVKHAPCQEVVETENRISTRSPSSSAGRMTAARSSPCRSSSPRIRRRASATSACIAYRSTTARRRACTGTSIRTARRTSAT